MTIIYCDGTLPSTSNVRYIAPSPYEQEGRISSTDHGRSWPRRKSQRPWRDMQDQDWRRYYMRAAYSATTGAKVTKATVGHQSRHDHTKCLMRMQ